MKKNQFKNIVICLLALPFIGYGQSNNIEILDSNNNGIINPYEALDMLLLLQKKNEKELTIKNFNTMVSNYEKELEEEISELLEEFDKNGDGEINLKEVKKDMKDFIEMMDKDKNGSVVISEIMEFDFTEALLASEEEVNVRIKEMFEETDTDRNGFIELSEVDKKKQDRYAEFDSNRDQRITREEVYAFIKADNTPVEFTVKGNTAYMTGVITSELPATVLELLFEHPNVNTIEMLIVPGSIDDEANLRAALYINQHGLTTKLNAKSSVASGGTDFFLAGKRRIVEKGAIIGIHSWGGGNVAATDVPKDDPVHQKYIDFYKVVGVPEAFYWYTLEAANADNIHMMTEEEIKTYKIRTNK